MPNSEKPSDILNSVEIAFAKTASRDEDAFDILNGTSTPAALKGKNRFFGNLPFGRYRITSIGNQSVE